MFEVIKTHLLHWTDGRCSWESKERMVHFSVALSPQKPSGLLGTGSPVQPPWLSHTSELCELLLYKIICLYEHLLSASTWEEPYMLHNGSYSALLSLCLCSGHMWLWMSDCSFYTAHLEYPLKWLQWCLIFTWLVLRETACYKLRHIYMP